MKSFWHNKREDLDLNMRDYPMFADPAEGEQPATYSLSNVLRIDWYKVLALVVILAICFGFWWPVIMTAQAWWLSR